MLFVVSLEVPGGISLALLHLARTLSTVHIAFLVYVYALNDGLLGLYACFLHDFSIKMQKNE